MPLILTGYF